MTNQLNNLQNNNQIPKTFLFAERIQMIYEIIAY